MVRIFPLIILLLISAFAHAQISPVDMQLLGQQEKEMQDDAFNIINGRTSEQRLEADSIFTRKFVKALKIKYAFDYPFDSLKTISILEPPDKRFRIFTWQLVVNDQVIRYHGAIQMNTKDGSLQLYPLVDRSSVMDKPEDTIVNNLTWMGSIYYNLVQTQFNGTTYYTLFGFRENGIRSSSKIIEILSFKQGQPVFGARIFDPKSFPKKARYIMYYKKDASPKLNFDGVFDIIIMEHLSSETGEPEKKYTYVPDGDYEGFRWNNGRWNYIDRVFTDETPGNMAPISHPLLDDNGEVIESNLKHNDH